MSLEVERSAPMRAQRSDFVPVELMPIRFAMVLSREALQMLSQERLFRAIHLLRSNSLKSVIDDFLIEILHTLTAKAERPR